MQSKSNMQAHHVDICDYARECSPYDEDDRTIKELIDDSLGIVDLADIPGIEVCSDDVLFGPNIIETVDGDRIDITDEEEAREYLLDELGESTQDITDFLEVEVFRSTSDRERYTVEFLLTCGGPTVRVVVDSRYDSVTLFHSWGFHVGRNEECQEWEIYDHRNEWLSVAEMFAEGGE